LAQIIKDPTPDDLAKITDPSLLLTYEGAVALLSNAAGALVVVYRTLEALQNSIIDDDGEPDPLIDELIGVALDGLPEIMKRDPSWPLTKPGMPRS
jgi:hypothetical protein